MNDCSKTTADGSQSSLLEPKEEPLDNFLFMPAENEPLNDSSLLISGPNGVLKIEDDFVDQAFMNSMESLSYMRAEMDIKDEESTNAHYAIADSMDCLSTVGEGGENSMVDTNIEEDEKKDDTVVNTTHAPIDSSDSVEVEKRRRPSRTVSKPLKYTESMDDSDEVEEPSVKKKRSESEKKNGQERSARGKVAHLGRAINSPQPKKKDAELECLECEFRTRSVSSWVAHLRRTHSTTPILSGHALLCECGHESESDRHSRFCKIASFTVVRKKDGPIRRLDHEKTNPQCVLCEVYPSTPHGYVLHLRIHHKSKSSLIANGIYLICSCGHEIRAEHHFTNHSSKCNGRDFSLHKLEKKTTPQCVLCESYPSTPLGYAYHLRVHHKSNLKTNGIYLICSCGEEIRSEHYSAVHSKKCDDLLEFTLHKLDDK